MTDTKLFSTHRTSLLKAAMPILAIAIAVCFAVFALLAWSSRMTDQIAVERQEQTPRPCFVPVAILDRS